MDTLPLKDGEVDLPGRTVRVGGEVSALSALETRLLRLLGEHPGEDVSRERILEVVWGAQAEGVSSRTVDSAVRRLRRKLGDPSPILTCHGVGYRFVPHRGAAREVPAAAPLAIVTGTLDLSSRWFRSNSGGEVRLGTTECALLSALASGASRTRHEVAEAVWGAGDHQAALSTCLGRVRRRIEADPARPQALTTQPGGRLLLAIRPGGSSNLGPGSPFVERPERVEGIAAVRRSRVVTLVGPAGIGKTRLARRVGRSLLGGGAQAVWFCDLASAEDAQAMTSAIASVLGVPRNGDSPAAFGEVLERLLPGTLLVLDSMEHLLRHGDLLQDWLEKAPQIRFLLTSRRVPQMPGEVVVVQPWSEAPSVALYGQHAGEHPAAEVAALVKRLDGVPLAIELAAARSARYPPAAMLTRAAEALDLLNRPSRQSRSHHSNLRSALDWSWELLDASLRHQLMVLGSFEGEFTVERAKSLLSDGVDLDALADASLVQRCAIGRYRLLWFVRDYVREKACLAGLEGLGERHTQLHLERVEHLLQLPRKLERLRVLCELVPDLVAIQAREGFTTRGATASLGVGFVHELQGRPEPAYEVYLRALSHAPDRVAWEMLGGMARTLGLRGDYSGALALQQRSMERAKRVSIESVAAVGVQLASTFMALGEFQEASIAAKEAMELYRGLPNRNHDLAITFGVLGRIETKRGQHLAAEAWYEEMLEVPEPGDVAVVSFPRAQVAIERGLLDRAEAIVRQEAGRATAIQAVHDAKCRSCLAQIRLLRGHHHGLDDELRAVEETFLGLGQPAWQQMCRLYRARLAVREGAVERALEHLHEPLAWRAAWHAPVVATTALLLGEPARGRASLAPLLAEPLPDPGSELELRTLDGVLALREGDVVQAEQLLAPASLGEGSATRRMQTLVQLGRGLLACASGQRDAGRQALGEARRRRSEDGHRYVDTSFVAFVLHAQLATAVRSQA